MSRSAASVLARRAFVAMALPWVLAAAAWGQRWAPLTGEDFARRLQSPTGIGWTGVPLREALEALGREQQIAVMLDRRVDPGRPVTLALAPQPLEHVLITIARQMDLGVCFVGPVAYFGPPAATQKLATVAAMRRREAERLPREAAFRLTRERPWGWELLSTPRKLLRELAEEGGLTIENLEQFPHDLWPAVQLPPLSLADRLTLVLAGFDLTYQISPDGKTLRLAPMPETAAIAQTYPGKGNPRENAARIARLYPEATVAVEGELIRVIGPWEVHQGAQALMQGRRVSRRTPPPGAPRRTVYSLKVENEPVGGVIKALAQQLNLTVAIDPAAEPRLTERISFDVAEVSREELLRAVLHPAGLTFRLEGEQLHVQRSGEPERGASNSKSRRAEP